ncbi:Aldo/keto reductase [Cenococcum geophilum 1.58]|uniref:Aldo/keto reductase n=1 Tax=Cenococcum geophilum 1.58 TaxID=794803 RepID=UPI00358DF752|nr:Aldo/keto reductase [Cenococcum geophilum 1.58]
MYGDNEGMLGAAGSGKDSVISTKVPGNIINDVKGAMQKLKMDNADTLYIYRPGSNTPLAETHGGINEMYKTGHFARFGLSNYLPDEVEAVCEHCKAHGYILSDVYQGNYSAVARKPEIILFPTLRRLGISFLTMTKEQAIGGEGYFNKEVIGGLYSRMYAKQSHFEALEEWNEIAKDEGCSKAALAYRWAAYNSPLKNEYGDAAGPLSNDACRRINAMWMTIEHDAPLNNFHGIKGGSQ